MIEHFFFPKFSISANPLALFAAAAQRTKRINFRTLLHLMPYHNPVVLASRDRRRRHPPRRPLRVRRRPRPRLDAARRPGSPLTPESRERYEESVELLFRRSRTSASRTTASTSRSRDSGIVPRPERKFRVFLGGTSDRTYELAAERGWAVVVPPLLPYAALAEQLDLYRAKCAEHGNEPDIVWIHACYIDEDREVAKREAKDWMVKLPAGERLAADRVRAAAGRRAERGRLRLLHRRDPREAGGDAVRGDDRRRHRLGRDAEDVIERIEAVQEVCAGLTEISITVNAGGADHWKAIKAQELFAHTVMPHFKAQQRKAVAVGLVIERVCVVGAGVIGSLYAAHLSRVADVWVLTRRPEHARALEATASTVSGRAEFTGESTPPPTRPSCRSSTSRSWRRRRRGSTTRRRSLAGRFAGRDGHDRPERPRRGAGRAPARRLAARLRRHVHERHAPRRHARRVHPRHRDVARARTTGSRTTASRSSPALIERSGLKARAFPDLRPAQWSKLIFNATVNAVAALTGLPHDAHFAAEERAVRPRPPRPRPHRRGQGGRRRGRDRAARGPVGDERARDPARQRALPVDARGRRGAPPDRDRADHRLARPRSGAARRAGAAAHGAVPPDQGEGGVMASNRESKGRQE